MSLTPNNIKDSRFEISEPLDAPNSISLHQLGILEGDSLTDLDRFPSIRGKGDLKAAIADCEMLALVQKVPFRRDSIQKILEDQFRR